MKPILQQSCDEVVGAQAYESQIKPQIEALEAERDQLKERLAKYEQDKCDLCGNDFTDEEKERNQYYGENKVCDECYHEHCEYTCPICEDYVYKDSNQKYILITKELAEDQKMEPGIYEILDLPWYWSDMFSMHIEKKSVRKVLELPEKALEECGDYICDECFKKLEREQLKAENERLKKALQPFANAGKIMTEDSFYCPIIDSNNLINAHEALKGATGEKENQRQGGDN